MRQTKINALTEGAMFGAIYGVLLLLVRFLFSSTDSLIYYFLPIPLALYVFRRGNRNGLILFAVLIAISFLFVDPYRALMLLIPNYLIGFLFGFFEKRGKPNVLSVVCVFALCLAADYLSIYAFQVITGTSYLSTMESEMAFIQNLFPSITEEYFQKMLILVLPAVLVLDSLVKTLILFVLFEIIVRYFKMRPETSNNPLRLFFHYSVSIAFVLFTITLFPVLAYGIPDFSLFWQILIVINLTLVVVLSLYLMYQGVYIISLYFGLKGKRGMGIALSILSVLLFPIPVLLGFIFNFTGLFFLAKPNFFE